MKVFSIGGLTLAALFWLPILAFAPQILAWFGVENSIIAQGVQNFRLFYSVFVLYGAMIMTVTFFQAIGDGKKAGMLIMLRQLVLFLPAMLIFPMLFGIKAVWFTEPIVDFIIVIAGLIMQQKQLHSMR